MMEVALLLLLRVVLERGKEPERYVTLILVPEPALVVLRMGHVR
jgi:hypothetical protein